MAKRQERPVESSQKFPLCQEEHELRKLRSHIGRHIEQIALFLIPGSVVADEEKEEEEEEEEDGARDQDDKEDQEDQKSKKDQEDHEGEETKKDVPQDLAKQPDTEGSDTRG